MKRNNASGSQKTKKRKEEEDKKKQDSGALLKFLTPQPSTDEVPKDEQDGTKRHESSPTPAPVEETTGSADRSGADWKHVAGGVVCVVVSVVVCVVVCVAVTVAVLLVKLGVIKKKKATPPTSTEVENLQAGAPEGDEDPGGAADRQLSHLCVIYPVLPLTEPI